MWNGPKNPERIVVDLLILIDILINMFLSKSIQKSRKQQLIQGF